MRAYKDGIDRHNSDGGPDAIRSDVREYQSLWTPDGLEEEQGGAWAMLVAVNAAVQRETAAAPQFLLSSSEAIMVDNNRVLHGREGYAYSGGDGVDSEQRRCTGASGAGPIGAGGRRGGMAEVGSPLDTENLQDYF